MYEIRLVNAEFGQLLNEDGDIQLEGEKEFHPEYDSLDSALQEKDNLINKYIYSCVIIKNKDTGEVTGSYCSENLGSKFLKEKQEYYKWIHMPIYKRLFNKNPKFTYYDGKH
ncbi:hypothetical protein MNBD_GAMMA12-1952 [hydrothermal vent metagenome]|uniref:Uncharacterized protein n=1 Tax=hydrothermal vent metagenome TaxID=652676 RepID=A0A3B0YR59_9ZZZZ